MRDPIVDEIHRRREERAAEFKNDLGAMFEDIRRMERESRAAGVRFVSVKPHRKPSVGAIKATVAPRHELPPGSRSKKEPLPDQGAG